MSDAAFAYPPRSMLRAVWPIYPLPEAFPAWQRDNLRRSTAFHEAAHAFMMLALGLASVRAVVSDDGAIGQARHSDSPPELGSAMPLEKRREGAIWTAACFHAGLEAELCLGGFNVPGGTEWRFSGSSDFKGADGALGDLFWRGRPHGYAKAVARACLVRNWASVERIAQVLLARGEWEPADTEDLAIRFGEGAESIEQACLAYGEPTPPEVSLVSPHPGESRPHSLDAAGDAPWPTDADARPERRLPSPGGASGVVKAPFVYPTISRRRPTQFSNTLAEATGPALQGG